MRKISLGKVGFFSLLFLLYLLTTVLIQCIIRLKQSRDRLKEYNIAAIPFGCLLRPGGQSEKGGGDGGYDAFAFVCTLYCTGIVGGTAVVLRGGGVRGGYRFGERTSCAGNGDGRNTPGDHCMAGWDVQQLYVRAGGILSEGTSGYFRTGGGSFQNGAGGIPDIAGNFSCGRNGAGCGTSLEQRKRNHGLSAGNEPDDGRRAVSGCEHTGSGFFRMQCCSDGDRQL